MKQLSSNELRALFLKFFQKKGHSVIPSASVIPENDPTVLFTTAGMHPLVPYLLGQKHPQGTRLTDVQKCIRTGDIDEVGDMSHLTFFEMLGNWSLGDYFKDQMIPWSWEFLTSPEWLGIDPDKLAFTVFEGDEDCPRDEEAANLWRKCGVKDDHLFYLPKEHNWWGPAGVTGPCGPDTEMFIITKKPCGPDCSPACHCGAYLEIWNDVFMQYNKQKDGSFIPLTQKNVDTGMGLERTICVLNGKKSVYETDAFTGILAKIEELCGKKYTPDDENTRAFRIVADHMRTSTFIIGDPRGIGPSNVGQGYILRRLIRRAVRYGMGLGLQEGFTAEIAKVIIDQYKAVYPELEQNKAFVLEQLTLEEGRFARTLKQGEKEFDKVMNNLRRTREAMEKILADDTLAAAEEAVKTHVLRPQPDMVSAIEAVKADFASVRAGRANASVLDRVQVEYYGSPTPLNQVASISSPDPRQLVIQPWDSSLLREIEKAILTSELGINPQNDGKVIRLTFPQLTEERRKELTKQVHKYAEGGKVAVRNIRRDVMDKIKAAKKRSEITEDDAKDYEKKLQDVTDKYVKKLDELAAEKEKELMSV